MVGWLVQYWLGIRNPLFLPAYGNELQRNNVALFPDIYFEFQIAKTCHRELNGHNADNIVEVVCKELATETDIFPVQRMIVIQCVLQRETEIASKRNMTFRCKCIAEVIPQRLQLQLQETLANLC